MPAGAHGGAASARPRQAAGEAISRELGTHRPGNHRPGGPLASDNVEMFGWLIDASTWLQGWLDPQAGLVGVFISALLSATILPGSTELVLTAKIIAYPALAWLALAVALCGSTIGCSLNFGMGQAARGGWERFKHVKVDVEHSRIQRLRRLGPPVLVLSVVPLVGDALVLAAGWLKMPFWQSLFWISLGKGTRYLLLVLGIKGLHSFV
jgi:membrane protein YqaA with SNARE-associated domain